MTEKEKRIERLLKRAESGAYDPQTDETLSEAARFSSERDRELARYRDVYDDVKQHGGVKENAFKSEDW